MTTSTEDSTLGSARDRFRLPRDEGSNKVMPLAEAIRRFVRPEMTIHLGYSYARPNAATMELVRQFAGTNPGFTISTAGLVSTQAPLLTEGLMIKAIASFIGDNYPSGGPNRLFQTAIDSGRLQVENWSLWSLVARLIAGAMNVPFLPVNSIRGSSLAEVAGFQTVKDPFTGAETGVVQSLQPDVVLLHGVAADPFGNVIMSPPYGESHWGALAAKVGVIATVERLVDTEFVREHSTLVKIPGHVVRAVCVAPLGSHPYGLYNPGIPGCSSYVEDEACILDQRQLCKDPAAIAAWTKEWVLGVHDHAGYLAKLGHERIQRLLGAGREEAWLYEKLQVTPAGYSSEEMMVVAAARRMQSLVETKGYRLLMAGIGLANLAAWLANDALKAAGRDIEVMSEIGMFGYVARPGEPFIFSNRNLPTVKMMTDVMGVLGTMVGGDRGSCLAALGAGQIDARGNVNSTRTAEGRFLVGSGGANDIASACAETVVLAKQSRHRLVASVPYITSPGTRTSTLVTSEGIYQKLAADGDLVLTHYFPVPEQSADETIAGIRSRCGWDLQMVREPEPVPPPEPAELELIRMYDVKRTFLGGDEG